MQINGAVGVDFSTPADERQVHQGLRKVGKLLYSHGVTSFCPTMVTSTPEVYRKVRCRQSHGTRSTCFVIAGYSVSCVAAGNRRRRRHVRSASRARRLHAHLYHVPYAFPPFGTGAHIEGPFIAVKGAHKEAYMRKSLEGGMDTVRDVLGNDLENVKVRTC